MKLRIPNFELKKVDSELPTPNSELTLDAVLLQVEQISKKSLGKGLRTPNSELRTILFWGEGIGEVSSYVAAWMASKGIEVIVLDGANRFDPYMVSSFARKMLISPERLLKKIRIARAFTCYQMATLIGEKLTRLLKAEETIVQVQKPWVILLGPITTFLDEDVPERESRPLFERSLRKAEALAEKGVHFFLFQDNSPSPPFTKGGLGGLLVKRGNGGLMDSKRAYLARRLFQFSNWVCRMSLEDQGLKLTLEKKSSSPLINSALTYKSPLPRWGRGAG